jgi:hypothetical protein
MTRGDLSGAAPGIRRGKVCLAGLLLPIAAVFQIFDGVQVVSAGVLRGAGGALSRSGWVCGGRTGRAGEGADGRKVLERRGDRSTGDRLGAALQSLRELVPKRLQLV